MFQIRARARAPLFGAPARALVRTSLVGSHRNFSKLFSPSPSFPVHNHGDPIALRKGLKRLLFQLFSIDASCTFPRGNREHACWESRARSPGSVRSMKYAYWEASGSKKIKRSQLTSTSELKTTERTKRCSKTTPMRDLVQHRHASLKKFHAASGPEKIAPRSDRGDPSDHL